MRILISLLIAGIMSGCAATYVPPSNVPLAEVTYRVIAGSSAMGIFLFDSYDCENAQSVKLFKQEAFDQEVTIEVAAGKPLINTFRISQYVTSLNFYYTTTEFTPAANQRYLITVEGNNYVDTLVTRYIASGLTLDGTVTKPEKVCQF